MDVSEHIPLAVLSVLETEFDFNDLSGLEEELLQFEEKVAACAKIEALEHLARSYKTFRLLSDDKLSVRGKTFLVYSGRALGRPIWELAIIPESSDLELCPSQSLPLDAQAWGFYTSVTVTIPVLLKRHQTALLEVIESVFTAAYEWLRQNILFHLREIENELSLALYSWLRAALSVAGRPELNDQFWLGIFGEGEGYYLLDREAAASVVSAVAERSLLSHVSPAHSAISFILSTLSFEDSLSRYAFADGASKDFSLPKAPYFESFVDYATVERQMIRGDEITVYPICKLGSLRLVANFSAKSSKNLLPILEAEREQLSRIFREKTSDAKNFMSQIRTFGKRGGYFNWAALGDFVGGLVGGLFKAMH